MAPVNPDKELPEKLKPQLEPLVQAASRYSSQSLIQWANLLYPTALENEDGDVIEHSLWRGRIGVFHDWVLKAGHECPYDVAYMMKLAETRQRLIEMGIGWDTFPVKPSVLIEGRNLDKEDLRRLLEEEAVADAKGKVLLTVSRMKAHVKIITKGLKEPVEVVEAEMSRARRDPRPPGKKPDPKGRTETMVQFVASVPDVDDVLIDLASMAHQYKERLLDLTDDMTKEVEFTNDSFKRAARGLSALTTTVEALLDIEKAEVEA